MEVAGADDPHAWAAGQDAMHMDSRAKQHLHRLGWGRSANDQ